MLEQVTERFEYKIRNDKGLFSTGGILPLFNQKGKAWKRLSDLKAHLQLGRYSNTSQLCIVVTRITESPEKVLSFEDVYTEASRDAYERHQKQKHAAARERLRCLEAQAEALRKQLETS